MLFGKKSAASALVVLALSSSAMANVSGLDKSKAGLEAMAQGVQQIGAGINNAIDERKERFVDVTGQVCLL